MTAASLLSVLVNALWQGAVMVAAVALLTRWAGNHTTASGRYVIWSAVLLALVALPIFGLLARRSPRLMSASPTATDSNTEVLNTGPGAGAAVPDTRYTVLESKGSSAGAEAGRDGGTWPNRMAALRAPVSLRIPQWAARGALLVLGLGVVGGFLAMSSAMIRLARLRRSLRPPSPELSAIGVAVRAQCGMTRRVRIGVSSAVTVPITLGFRRPIVLLPRSMAQALDPAELSHVLAHEFGHVARRDDWAMFAQRVLSALLFFHPAAHIASRRIEIERELACDDWALGRTGVERVEYARSLVRVGELALAGGHQVLPSGAISMASHLAGRIQALLSSVGAPTPASHAFVAGMVSVAILAGTGLGRLAAVRIEANEHIGAAPLPLEIDAPGAALRVQSLMERYESWGFHGAVLVMHQGRVVVRGGYGLADRGRGTRWTPETAFNGGAVAKMLTAAAVLKLEEEGRLQVSDRVARYLGPFPAPKTDVTIHQLMTHTAGLARQWAPIYRDNRDDFIRAIKDTPADYPAGKGFRYTDHGHALLAAVIEVASGMPYETYVRRALLEPAGMSHTRFENEPPTGAPIAMEYTEPAGTGSRVSARPYRWGRRGAMGVVTTVDDLWNWYRALEDGRILNSTSLTRMFTGYVNDGRRTSIGYGWETGTSIRGTRIRHRLSAWGSNSVEVLYDLDHNLFVALVANAPVDWNRPKYEELASAMLGLPHLLPPEPNNSPVSEIRRLEGRYVASDGTRFDVTAAAPGALYIRVTNAATSAALPAHALARELEHGSFAMLHWARHRLINIQFAESPMASLQLKSGGPTLRATRVPN